MNEDQEKAVEERCQCGDKKSDHQDRGFGKNHGECSRCISCRQFTFKNFIFADGAESLYYLRQKS